MMNEEEKAAFIKECETKFSTRYTLKDPVFERAVERNRNLEPPMEPNWPPERSGFTDRAHRPYSNNTDHDDRRNRFDRSRERHEPARHSRSFDNRRDNEGDRHGSRDRYNEMHDDRHYSDKRQK